jgi:DNA-directed RNA polymerase specialized sigma24 family protein
LARCFVPRLSLHDVDDAAKFVASIATRSNLRLSYHDQEDLHQYLLVEAWKLSVQEPRPWRTSFSGWVTPLLRLRIVDWQRQRNGRTVWKFANHTYERERPQLLSLDDPERDHLGAALAASTSDPAASGDTSLAWLVGAGDRTRAQDYEALGLRPPRRAP